MGATPYDKAPVDASLRLMTGQKAGGLFPS